MIMRSNFALDPFCVDGGDLLSLVTAATLSRLQEEFQLAKGLFETEPAPLSRLLEQWVPDATEEAPSK